MNNENPVNNQGLEVLPHVGDGELLLPASSDTSVSEPVAETPSLSMLGDKPAEPSTDFSTLGHEDESKEKLSETSSDSSSAETSTELDVVEQPSLTLTDKIDDHIEKQKQHNVFEYVNIVAEHAKSAVIQSGYLENPDGTRGDPFAKVILSVDHDEIMEFIEKYGTNFTLGLPTGHELSAKVSLNGDESAKNEIIVELPLSGRAADEFFREDTTHPIVTHAFDVAYAKEVDEKSNQLNDAQ